MATTEGIINFLGEIAAVGGFDECAKTSVVLDLGGFSCRVLSIAALVACKRALARPRDLRVVQELEAVMTRLRR